MMNDIKNECATAVNNLQDEFLQCAVSKRSLIDIYLASGIRLQGYINGFDKHTIFLSKIVENKDVLISQMIYKHAISTIGYAA